MNKIRNKDLFDLDKTLATSLLASYEYPWEALPHIKDFILQLGHTLPETEYSCPSEHVWISKKARIAPTAFIGETVIIGPGSEIRHCAYIRGNALIGADCVVGNSTEIKNAILFDRVQTPHFNYVGDSILGYKAHLGAGAVTSNVKSDRTFITVKDNGEQIVSNMKKFGAMIGDYTEVGCNTVLNPGTVIGRHTNIYPGLCVRGVVPEESIYKDTNKIVRKKERI